MSLSAQVRQGGADDGDRAEQIGVEHLPDVVVGGLLDGGEVEWLKVCMRLRSSGMPLPEIRRYAELVVAGPGTEAERFEILREHEARVQQQVADLQEALAVIHGKVEIYARHLAEGTADQLWRNVPECHVAPDAG